MNRVMFVQIKESQYVVCEFLQSFADGGSQVPAVPTQFFGVHFCPLKSHNIEYIII